MPTYKTINKRQHSWQLDRLPDNVSSRITRASAWSDDGARPLNRQTDGQEFTPVSIYAPNNKHTFNVFSCILCFVTFNIRFALNRNIFMNECLLSHSISFGLYLYIPYLTSRILCICVSGGHCCLRKRCYNYFYYHLSCNCISQFIWSLHSNTFSAYDLFTVT